MTKEKRCKTCGKVKPISEFYMRRKNSWFAQCKDCLNKKRRQDRAGAPKRKRYCQTCGEPLNNPKSNQIYCKLCAKKHAKESWTEHKKRKKTENKLVLCKNCPHLELCKANIWDKNFEPPCFMGEPIEIELPAYQEEERIGSG